MKKTTMNFIINVLMFLCLSAIVGIGFLIKYTLIPGQERWVVYGKNVELYLFGMDRHEWGTIHLIIGFVLLGLLLLHLILHWKIIVCMYNRLIKKKYLRNLIALIFIITIAFVIIISFFIKPEVEEIKRGMGRERTNNRLNRKEINTITTYENEKFKKNKATETLKYSNSIIKIRGYMTLDEISKKKFQLII